MAKLAEFQEKNVGVTNRDTTENLKSTRILFSVNEAIEIMESEMFLVEEAKILDANFYTGLLNALSNAFRNM